MGSEKCVCETSSLYLTTLHSMYLALGGLALHHRLVGLCPKACRVLAHGFQLLRDWLRPA
jgi:hypothetical protein